MKSAFSFHFPAASWRRGSACHANNTCVEVARLTADCLGTRDSKQGEHSPVLRFTPQQWRAFAEQVKAGAFDLA
ncbi:MULTISPECIES: DUF397 domain-containing protein [Thermomonospora]|uniref:DUF397 domain-containing protein n=1 Tax=Thermomonospora curvata (strain ATCC 19995 / DSM 43183 / JCM 3096 / KCTC 9072 / NBRC 15933 / NCIMB 10081 / Henssen B9) TaxID=471852 RepID=D1A328_THECD|nr:MULTISPECIES: DUF397 domain-containing protein [Thermomonospora]ACY99798.1 protein of unknown function DUF397 [Thermomonospora curvata DSM 43183]